MAGRARLRGIRRNRTYTYEDLAARLGVSSQTIRSWRSRGLRVMISTRPHLILGEAIIEFLDQRRSERRVSLAEDQFFCLACRKAVRPWGMLVDAIPVEARRSRLTALCEHCSGTCNRFVGGDALGRLAGIFEIKIRSGE